jgi:hypothetical protein
MPPGFADRNSKTNSRKVLEMSQIPENPSRKWQVFELTSRALDLTNARYDV